ncbi:hypothetical protein CDD83_1376 [Cordyceps sp. RAO-2017]|nr:hypothetical protein CDD83_1376 [Cordyceps sp. RAO-2017]
MVSLVSCAAILAAGRIVAAKPTESAAGNATTHTGKLSPLIWINDRPIDRTQAGSPCSPDNDIMECATNIWKNYTVSPEAELGKRTVDVAVKLTPDNWLPDWDDRYLRNATLELPYETKVVSCSLSDPQIISKEPLFFCNVDCAMPQHPPYITYVLGDADINASAACSESFKFTHSTTDVTQYGYSVAVSVSASFDIFFASTEVSVSGDFHNDWSTSSTTEETVEKIYNMAKGEVCAPTSIQIKVSCRSSFTPNGNTFKVTPQEGEVMHLSIDSNELRGENVEAIRQAIKTDAPVSFDVGSGGTANKPWVIEGCMFR